MPANLLIDARKFRIAAVASLLESYYPTVHRLAYALCGEQAAREVIQRVFSRALYALPKWRDDSTADRWFYHYTVLASRNCSREHNAPDPLLNDEASDPGYAALIRGLRALPTQQREAIVLSHGEHLNFRYLAVAMDCSTEAAANHLRMATQALELIGGDKLAALLAIFSQAYRRLAPSPDAVRPMIRRRINRYLLPRRLRRGIFALAALITLYALWRWR